MITATIYNKITGVINRTLTCLPLDVDLNCKEGESWVEGVYNPNEYIIKEGKAVRLPEKSIQLSNLDLETLTWVPDVERMWAKIRYERAVELNNTDWTQVPDAPVDQSTWAKYRQALRNLPENTEDPANPQWPTPPE
jgi:hypothetical protein